MSNVRRHVLALLFGPPFVFAFALGLFGAASKRGWVVAAVIVGCVQALAVSAAGPHEQRLSVLFFSVGVPWLAVVALLSLSGLPRHALLVALLVPVVFALVVFAGIILGVNAGLLRV